MKPLWGILIVLLVTGSALYFGMKWRGHPDDSSAASDAAETIEQSKSAQAEGRPAATAPVPAAAVQSSSPSAIKTNVAENGAAAATGSPGDDPLKGSHSIIPEEKLRNLSPGIAMAQLTYSEYEKYFSHDKWEGPRDDDFETINIPISRYDGEPTLYGISPVADCQAIKNYGKPVIVRVGAGGNVVEAVPQLDPTETVPPDVYNCKFPSRDNGYLTVYSPTGMH